MDSISDQKDSFQKAAEKMAEFWTSLLKKGAANNLVERWVSGKHRISEHQFEIELMQASNAVSSAARNENTYSDEELETFRKTLEALIVEREIEAIQMKYHPDDVLADAGKAANIHIGMTTFPADTGIYYSSSGEYLETILGRSAARQRIYLNPEENPPVYGFLVYQLNENGPLKALQLNEWELPRYEDERDRIVSEAEGTPAYTLSIVPWRATSAEEAIEQVQQHGRYKYEPPADVATRFLENTIAKYGETPEDVDALITQGARPTPLALYQAITHLNGPIAKRILELGADFHGAVRVLADDSFKHTSTTPSDAHQAMIQKNDPENERMKQFIQEFSPHR